MTLRIILGLYINNGILSIYIYRKFYLYLNQTKYVFLLHVYNIGRWDPI